MASSLTPKIIDIDIPQGVDWERTYTWTDDGDPVSLSGYSAAMEIKKTWTSPALVTLSSEPSGGLTIEGGEGPGTITAQIAAAVTDALPATDEQLWVYDIWIKNPADKASRLVQGTVVVSPRVTAPLSP